MKILNVQWFCDIGIITVSNGREIKTYIKKVDGFDEKEDIESILRLGHKVYPQQLEKILSFYKSKESKEKRRINNE